MISSRKNSHKKHPLVLMLHTSPCYLSIFCISLSVLIVHFADIEKRAGASMLIIRKFDIMGGAKK